MRRTRLAVILSLALGAAPALAAPHVTLDEARRIALARVPGTIVHEKLKHPKKKQRGAHDVYSIKIAPRDHAPDDHRWRKVTIDAESGQVLGVKDVKPRTYD